MSLDKNARGEMAINRHIYQWPQDKPDCPKFHRSDVRGGRRGHLQSTALHVPVHLYVAVYLPTRALTPPKHSIVDVHEGANAFWGRGWPAGGCHNGHGLRRASWRLMAP